MNDLTLTINGRRSVAQNNFDDIPKLLDTLMTTHQDGGTPVHFNAAHLRVKEDGLLVGANLSLKAEVDKLETDRRRLAEVAVSVGLVEDVAAAKEQITVRG
jgi:hypothetical protein